MKLTDFQFNLPDELIARYPLPSRSESRLLCVDSKSETLSHCHFKTVIDLIQPGDLLVFNDTKVIPARLFGNKITGGLVEVLVERILDNQRLLAQVRVSKPPRIGDSLMFPNGISLMVTDRQNHFYELRNTQAGQPILDVIESIGQIPLPPYMNREPEESDKERYQTIYAKHKGSVAAPTAGFHFDAQMLQELQAKGVETGYLTLHIGAGTFAPVRVDDIRDHKMHAEYLEITPELSEKISTTKARGNRVIAVGTTSLRSLETASSSGKTVPFCGDTNIFIYPGYQFQCVDALITNLHLPGSTLLMLVCAFAGHKLIMSAYQEAILQRYRFYSYGDAMFIT